MRTLIFATLMLFVSSCASFTEPHSKTLLMNRNTGEFKDCTVDRWRSKESYEVYKNCIKTFEKEGYTIWNQY